MAGQEEKSVTTLECDYLVVGAGTAGMSFVDTILTENPSATAILVDRNAKPGGHWNHAYPFVQLHQPSCYYGVNSLPLGKIRNKKGHELYDVFDRATGAEILDYFEQVSNNFMATGRVKCFFDAEYQTLDSEDDQSATRHSIRMMKTKDTYRIHCRKLVSCASKVIVPSMRKPLIPVHEKVHFVPPNEIPSCCKSGKYKNYIVIGNGKSGMDAIVQLVREEMIAPSQITWVLGADAWIVNRDMMQKFWKTVKVVGMLVSVSSVNDMYLKWESEGLVCRLQDPNRPKFPSCFKAPVLDSSEFEVILSIQNLIRRKHVASIESNQLIFQDESQPALEFSPEDTLLVDCMVDNLYGYDFPADFQIFESDRINLGPGLAFFNVSFSSAMVAFVETCIDREYKQGNSTSSDLEHLKNTQLVFLRGKYATAHPETFLGAYFMHSKNMKVVEKLKGGMKFLLESRTNDMATFHHKGGMWRILWELYGPSQLHKLEPTLCNLVESKRYTDLDHCFGIETFQNQTEGGGERQSQAIDSRGNTRCFKGCFRRRREEASKDT